MFDPSIVSTLILNVHQMNIISTNATLGERGGLVIRISYSGARSRGSILARVAVFVLEQDTVYSPKLLEIPRKR